MKKAFLISILFFLLIPIVSCSPVEEAEINVEETKTITILLSKHNTMNHDKYPATEMALYTRHLNLLKREFTSNTGIEVIFKYPNSNTQEEYFKNRNTELYLDNGPELILIAGGEDFRNLINEGVALKIEDKIPNYKDIYEALTDGYYVPMAMAVDTFFLNKDALRNLGIENPNSSWNEIDFQRIMDLFYRDGRSYLTHEAVHITINSILSDNSLYINKGEFNIANDHLVSAIEDIRYQLLESSRFKKRDHYTYENYYNMMYKPFGQLAGTNDENTDIWEAITESQDHNPYVGLWGTTNSLNSLETDTNKAAYIRYARDMLINTQEINDDHALLLPRPYQTYSSWGFIVNSKGKNIEAAMEFLSFLLSNEAQMKVFTDLTNKFYDAYISFSTPVIKTVENEIGELEVQKGIDEEIVMLRKEVLRQITSGERIRNYRGGASLRGAYIITEKSLSEVQEKLFKEELETIILKVVFGDKHYSSDEIIKELRELDNRMRLVLSE